MPDSCPTRLLVRREEDDTDPPAKLPPIIAHYLEAASSHDLEGMITGFAGDAVVRDEDRTHRGAAAIRAWMEETIATYRYRIEPTGFSERGGKSIVTGLVSGNFPGSPVSLRHEFTLENGKIVRLEIS